MIRRQGVDVGDARGVEEAGEDGCEGFRGEEVRGERGWVEMRAVGVRRKKKKESVLRALYRQLDG